VNKILAEATWQEFKTKLAGVVAGGGCRNKATRVDRLKLKRFNASMPWTQFSCQFGATWTTTAGESLGEIHTPIGCPAEHPYRNKL
jgi:hypothetical protein